MGIQNSNEKSQEWSPKIANSYKSKVDNLIANKTKEIYSQMTQKVLQSQEEIYNQHLINRNKTKKENAGAFSQRLYELEFENDLYFSYMSTHKNTSRKQLGLTTILDSNENLKIANCKYPMKSLLNYSNDKGNLNKLRNGKILITRPKSMIKNKIKPINLKKIAEENKVSSKQILKVQLSNNDEVDINSDDFEDKSTTANQQQFKESCRNSIILKVDAQKKLPQFDMLSLLPSNIFMNILNYAIDNFRCFLSVNPSWYHAITTAFDNHFNSLENSFVQKYAQFFLFKDSYTSSSIIHLGNPGAIRIDRVFKFENLECSMGNTIIIGYTYKYCGEPKNVYKAEFQFDSVKKDSNCYWIHKNQCHVN